MIWHRSRWFVLALVVGALIWSVVNSVRRVGQVRLSADVCGAFESRDFEGAILASSELAARNVRASDGKLLEAVECRCLALVGVGQGDSCSEEIAQWVQRPALRSWVPRPVLAAAAIDQLERQEKFSRAIELAHAAATEFQQSALFHSREFRVRLRAQREHREGRESKDDGRTTENSSRNPDEERSALLAEFEQRLTRLGDRAADLPVLLAGQYSDDARWQDALRVLGENPPADPSLAKEWFQARTRGLAGLGDTGGLSRSFERWANTLGASADVAAWRAFQHSHSNLFPTALVAIEELAKALHAEEEIADVSLRVAVRRRLIRTLASVGRANEALVLLDATVTRYGPVAGLDRGEIERAGLAVAGEENGRGASRGEREGTLRFVGLASGDQLLVSPARWTDPNRAFERIGLGSSALVTRSVSSRPVWWLVLDSTDRVVAEGSVWVEGEVRQTVEIVRQEPMPLAGWRAVGSTPRGGAGGAGGRDGRARVIQLILDSGDWRILRLLLAANRTPNFQTLIGIAAYGTILSEPPYTAAALQALTRPSEKTFAVLQLVHQLGEEVEALNFVGRNPVQGLAAILPKVPTVFETLGSGPLRTVNLLRSVGGLRAGRHAVVTGPDGATGQLQGYRGSRELSASEIGTIPGLSGDLDGVLNFFEEAAADFDTIEKIIAKGEIDYVSARVASLDLMTHGHYAELREDGQYERLPSLLLFYQYLDFRLGELLAMLGDHDFLIVMSDHGALSSLEHDPRSVFFLLGPSVESGPFDAVPSLAGVSRLVAELLGAKTDWPANELLDLVALSN